jgi:hypothetical protein
MLLEDYKPFKLCFHTGGAICSSTCFLPPLLPVCTHLLLNHSNSCATMFSLIQKLKQGWYSFNPKTICTLVHPNKLHSHTQILLGARLILGVWLQTEVFGEVWVFRLFGDLEPHLAVPCWVKDHGSNKLSAGTQSTILPTSWHHVSMLLSPT